jgi:serine/threonine protein kinase
VLPKLLSGPDVSESKRRGHVESIKREVEVLRRLAGSLAVVRLVDAYEDDDSVFIVQELCRGGELHHRINDRHYSERTVRRRWGRGGKGGCRGAAGQRQGAGGLACGRR